MASPRPEPSPTPNPLPPHTCPPACLQPLTLALPLTRATATPLIRTAVLNTPFEGTCVPCAPSGWTLALETTATVRPMATFSWGSAAAARTGATGLLVDITQSTADYAQIKLVVSGMGTAGRTFR